jgi:hypothetical protein
MMNYHISEEETRNACRIQCGNLLLSVSVEDREGYQDVIQKVKSKQGVA